MDQIVREEDRQFCHYQWNPNWNGEEMVSTAHVTGRALWMGTVMGLMIIDLDETDSVEAFCRQLRGAADHAESIKKRYDTDGYVPEATEAWYGYEDGDENNDTATEPRSDNDDDKRVGEIPDLSK